MTSHQDSHTHAQGETGSMDISGHVKTWAGFVKFVKYSSVGVILIVVFLAIFRTH